MASLSMRQFTRQRVRQISSRVQLSTTPTRNHSSSLRPMFLLNYQNNQPPFSLATRPSLRFRTNNSTHPHYNHRQPTRPFSLSALAPVLDHSVSQAQTLLTALHNTLPGGGGGGAAWYLAIPAFALLVNLAARLPATLYARHVARRRARLQPLVVAHAARAHRDLRKGSQSQSQSSSIWTSIKLDRDRRTIQAGIPPEWSKLARRWGVQGWKLWAPSLAVFPFWVVGIEALRRMCGGPRGVIGALLLGEKKGDGKGGQDVGVHETAAGWGADSSPEVMGQAQQVQQVLGSYDADPSMVTGGCLWFPDLTAADPYCILPFALSGILVLNTWPRTGAAQLFGLTSKSPVMPAEYKWSLRLQRALLVVAMAIGPATMDLPAALHLYWLSSATLTYVQTELIARWLMPLPKPVHPAKPAEPMVIMPKREERAKTR
ncbi:hypothetical protein VTK56DRAFT_8768 [Thermocarpiscus australiensis]